MNPEALRGDIPALDETVYLDTGSICPSPRRVVDAAQAALEQLEFQASTTEGAWPAKFATAVEGATLAVVSSLTWTHGTRLPVAELTEMAHDAGARVLVDAVRFIGQHPVDVERWGADAVVGARHK